MFRKSLIALAATAMVAGPLMTAPAMAQPGRHDNRPAMRHDNDRHDNHRSWAKGQRFDHRYADHYMVINNYRAYHLRQPPRGYHWVRSGDDAVLVAITGGLIASVLANVIH